MAPLTGEVVELTETEDPVFAEKMMGDGVAIMPQEGVVVAPFDGEVVTLFPTGHAVGLKNKDGVELLIHVGIDTVHLEGKGFVKKVEQGDKVRCGQALIEADLETIKAAGKKVVTPVIVTNGDAFKIVDQVAVGTRVTAGLSELYKIEKA
ncbi:MAG: PTS glucose transporter subunit IIA [Negativicutes bacterium]|nr:PTS glucose transporter subunit IIA [Negativicutes bacterium]